ncbi:MAG: hypothetical protein HY720_23935 [Planctomycetes bacterium]|nr:hypothetical protein [Planctomycetota bacterium]
MASGDEIRRALLDFIRARTGLGPPGDCQFEDLGVFRREADAEGTMVLHFTYRFDRDGFSQYDRTVTFTGRAKLDANGRVVEGEVEEVARGEDF